MSKPNDREVTARAHCPLWLSSQCHGGTNCSCVARVADSQREDQAQRRREEAIAERTRARARKTNQNGDPS